MKVLKADIKAAQAALAALADEDRRDVVKVTDKALTAARQEVGASLVEAGIHRDGAVERAAEKVLDAMGAAWAECIIGGRE